MKIHPICRRTAKKNWTYSRIKSLLLFKRLLNCSRDKMKYNYFQLSPVLFVQFSVSIFHSCRTHSPLGKLPLFFDFGSIDSTHGKTKKCQKHFNSSTIVHANQKQFIFLHCQFSILTLAIYLFYSFVWISFLMNVKLNFKSVYFGFDWFLMCTVFFFLLNIGLYI